MLYIHYNVGTELAMLLWYIKIVLNILKIVSADKTAKHKKFVRNIPTCIYIQTHVSRQ